MFLKTKPKECQPQIKPLPNPMNDFGINIRNIVQILTEIEKMKRKKREEEKEKRQKQKKLN